MVWVQDYHLMLLPALLKKQKPKMKVRSCTRSPPAATLIKQLGMQSLCAGCCAWAAHAQQRSCVACLPLHRRKYCQLNDYTLCQHREMSRGLMSCQGTPKCASPTLVRHRIGWLVPAHAVPVIGDLPHAAGARGGAAGGAQGRPDRVPHLRLCAALHQLLHPHPGPGGAQQPSLRNQSCFFRMS